MFTDHKNSRAAVRLAIALSLCASAASASDPDLEPGFPIQTWHGAGTYHSGPHIHATVGNIDSDPQLELVFSGLAQGPLYAFNHDGSQVSGWPADMGLTVGLPVMAQLQGGTTSPLEVFAGFRGRPGPLGAWDAAGQMLPGWPRNSANFVSTSPSAADIDGDGIDELFVCEEFNRVAAYRADGSTPPGWVSQALGGGQRCETPAVADLDGDGLLEIATVTSSTNGSSFLYVLSSNGTVLPGFPVDFRAYADTYPVIGDVDADGAEEIVVVASESAYPWRMVIKVYSAQGQLEREILASESVDYGTAPALADLNLDGTPDIIVQGGAQLFVWNGITGAMLPGWPQVIGRKGESAPAVGDVDGDGLPDIVVASALGRVHVFNRLGVQHPSFPKQLPLGDAAMPAIADIDRDGRNEIIVMGDYWNGQSGEYDKVWVYDLKGPAHGAIEWGQFGNDAAHRSHYVRP